MAVRRHAPKHGMFDIKRKRSIGFGQFLGTEKRCPFVGVRFSPTGKNDRAKR